MRLVSWVGGNGLEASEAKHDKPGAVAATVTKISFVELHLLYSYPEKRVIVYLDWLKERTHVSINARFATLNSPIDFHDIYIAADILLARRKRQQAIKLADDSLRSVFLEMFRDPVTNPKEWEVKKLGDVGTLDLCKSKHRPRNDPKLLGGEHPSIQTDDVASSNGYIPDYRSTYSDFGLAQGKKWNERTLCITISANIAKTKVLTFDACFPESVVDFLPNELVTVEYIQHWVGFLQKNLEASAPESAQKNIYLEILRNLKLPILGFDLRKAFTKVVNKVLEKGERFNLSEKTLDDLFLSLSQRAFSGEI